MIVNSSGENEVSCAFLKDIFEMYQSSPVTSNTKFALPVFFDIMFWDISCFDWYIAEPLTVKKSCVKFEELKNALTDLFESSIEPLNRVLNSNVYSTSFDT